MVGWIIYSQRNMSTRSVNKFPMQILVLCRYSGAERAVELSTFGNKNATPEQGSQGFGTRWVSM